MKRSLTRLLGNGPRLRGRVALALVLSSAIVSGCAGATGFQKGFDTDYASGGRAEREVIERLSQITPQAPGPVAVGVTGRGLVGRILPEGKRWEYTGEVDTLPAISGGAVAISGDGVVTLIDLASGEVIWNDVPTGGRLLESMAYDGQRAILILTDPDDSRQDLLRYVVTKRKPTPSKSGHGAGATVTSYTGDFDKKRDVYSEAALGRPTAVPGLALVPWNAEYVTALDLATLEPLGVLRSPNAVTAVRADTEGFSLLGKGVVAVSEHLLDDKPPKALRLPNRKLPGNPVWPGDGTLTRDAEPQSVLVLARPKRRGARLELAGNAYASAYFRVVLGFGAPKGNLRWVTYFLRDILDGDASDGGATLCLEDGSIWRLSSKDGARAPSGHLGARLRACVVQADPRPVTATVTEPLITQISSTLINTGPDMAPVHGILLDELSKNTSVEVTGILLEIAQSPNASADLADQAAKRLEKRRNGSGLMIAALEEGPDSDTAKRPPPLKQLANALAAMNAKKAAGPLAAHLLDPRASVSDQLALARALSKLSDADESKPLRNYFTLYRSAAAEPDLAEAVLTVAETLWRVGGPEDRDLVSNAAADPMTHPAVRDGLVALLRRLDPPAASASPAALAPPGVAAGQPATAAPPAQNAPGPTTPPAARVPQQNP